MTRVVVKRQEHGPYLVVVDGKPLASLCSCGLSSRKPLCDRTHERSRLTDLGASITRSEPAGVTQELGRVSPSTVKARRVCRTCGQVNPEWVRNYCVRCAARLNMD
jgi:CDGSH-type Zn-finger protein